MERRREEDSWRGEEEKIGEEAKRRRELERLRGKDRWKGEEEKKGGEV